MAVMGAAEEQQTRWTDVFSRSSFEPYGYHVRKDWQDAVEGFVARHGSDLHYSYLGSMGGYGGEQWTAKMLDGDFVHTKGVMWTYGGGMGNRLWLSEHRAIRYVLYAFDVPQPRRWAGEERIPTYEELDEEARAMREVNEGSWKCV